MASLQNSATSKKRRFQPPITNYFVASTPETLLATGLSHQNYSAPTNTPTPALPDNILSSLLGVGARIRKAVPDGYRTEQQKKLTTYTRPNPIRESRSDLAISQQRSATLYAELEPFCGIHKIGNHAVQTFPRPDEQYRNSNLMTAANADDLDNFSVPSSSQESNTSMASSSSYMNKSASNKRGYDSDVNDEEDYYSSSAAAPHHNFVPGGVQSDKIWQDTVMNGPHSHTSTSFSSAISQRTILSPKLGQRRRLIASTSMWKTHAEQENEDPLASSDNGKAVPAGEMMDLDDFGEASFLRRREEVDVDYL